MNSQEPAYTDIVVKLHKLIEDGKLENVETFLNQHKFNDGERFYNDDLESAAAIAVDLELHEIYKLLLSRGISLGPHEHMDELVENQSEYLKNKFHYIHKKFYKDPTIKYLQALNSKFKLSHEASASERQAMLALIAAAFEDLNKLKLIQPILKVVSHSANLKIVFDFNRESVASLDPTMHRFVAGIAYSDDGYIYLGAKGLTDDQEARGQALGILAHELCHFAMNLLYDNNCNPYRETNRAKLSEFSEIATVTELKKDSEDIVRGVFDNYEVIKHHSE